MFALISYIFLVLGFYYMVLLVYVLELAGNEARDKNNEIIPRHICYLVIYLGDCIVCSTELREKNILLCGKRFFWIKLDIYAN